MLGSEMISKVRYRIRDTAEETYSDAELLMYCNDAVQIMGSILIRSGHQHLIEKGSFEEGDSLPTGWVRWCGNVPAEVYGSVIHLLTGAETPMEAKFFRIPVAMATTAATVDLPDEMLPVTIVQASIMALNRNGLDVTQDISLASAMLSALGVSGA